MAGNVYTWQNLVDTCYGETNRPDLIDQTASALRAATLKMHGIMGNFFAKDLVQKIYQFAAPGYIQTLSTDELPFFRKLKHARKWDPSFQPSQINPYAANLLPSLNSIYGITSPTETLAPFNFIDVDDIFDDYKAEKTNVAYLAGDAIHFKSSTQFQFVIISYYAWPNLGLTDSGASYYSWIANEHPYAIIYDACANLYRAVGDMDSARDLNNPRTGLLTYEIASLVASNATVIGD